MGVFTPASYFFTTTLSISPLKNAQKLNEIGSKLEAEYGLKYLYSDFKKQKSEFLKNTQNVLEELYDKGKISQDKLNKIKDNKM